jgi:uncharacterized protein
LIIDLAALRQSKTPLLVKSAFAKDDFGFEDETVELVEPVQVDLRVSTLDERVRVEGSIKTVLVLTCSRCACRFSWDTDQDFALEYWPDTTDEGEVELDYEDLDVGFYLGDKFDLSEVILEQILIDIPMNPLCKDDCRGLCESCGADLNCEECTCGEEKVDSRFEALLEIRNRMK